MTEKKIKEWDLKIVVVLLKEGSVPFLNYRFVGLSIYYHRLTWRHLIP